MTTAQVDKAASPAPALPVDQDTRLRQWRDRLDLRLTGWFARGNRALANQSVWVGAIVCALALQVTLIVLHQPWNDEWQALQISVQSPRLADLLFNLRYEGHPPLWYLILRGLAGLFADPAWALPAAALLIAVPLQMLILLRAPFSRLERVMLALSELVLIEFLTISRSLTLGFAMMILAAAWWRRPRLAWLPIVFLPLCDFLFGVVSLIFVVLRWRERRMSWPLAGLWVISGLVSAWTIRGMPDRVSALLPVGPIKDTMLWAANFATLGLPLQWNLWWPQWNSPSPPLLGGFALAGFLAMVWIELRPNLDRLAAFVLFTLLTLVFSVTVYQLSIRHLAIAVALLIVFVWRKADDFAGVPAGDRSVWWYAWLMTSAVCGLITAGINLVEPFDTAPGAVAEIQRLGLSHKTWVPFPHSAGQGIAAISGMPFERLAQHCSEDFVRWNAPDDHNVKGAAALVLRLTRKRDEDGRFYMVSWYNLPDVPHLMRRIATIKPGYDGQAFNLFVVGEDRRDARPHGTFCNGPRQTLRGI